MAFPLFPKSLTETEKCIRNQKEQNRIAEASVAAAYTNAHSPDTAMFYPNE